MIPEKDAVGDNNTKEMMEQSFCVGDKKNQVLNNLDFERYQHPKTLH